MPVPPQFKKGGKPKPGGKPGDKDAKSCLLYTSDAADD